MPTFSYKHINTFYERINKYKEKYNLTEIEIEEIKNIFIKFYPEFMNIFEKEYNDRCNLFSYKFFIEAIAHYVRKNQCMFLITCAKMKRLFYETFIKTFYNLGYSFD